MIFARVDVEPNTSALATNMLYHEMFNWFRIQREQLCMETDVS